MANWWDAAPAASPFDVAVATEGYDPKFATFANSIYMQESSGGKNAKTSNAGAVGGMQIIPSTFKEVADDGWDINNPEHNLRAGLRYLKKMYDAGGGDPYLAAVGYYGGPGAIKAMQNGQVRRDPRNPNAPDTAQYADQVLSRAGINWWDSAPLAEDSQTQIPVVPQQTPDYSGGIPWNPNQIQPDGLGGPEPEGGGIMAGIGQGLRDPIDAGAQMLRRAVPDSVGKAIDQFGNWLSDAGLPVARSSGVEGVDQIVNQTNADYEAARAAAGREGIDWARIGGNVAATLPLMATPMGATTTAGRMGVGAAQGAAIGALNPVVGQEAQQDYASSLGKNIALGAGVGAITPAIVGGVARIISPNASQAGSTARLLRSEGVNLTPGQISGGAVGRMEDRLMSAPILGDAIRGARGRAQEQLNRAVYNRVLEPIGEKTTKVGREAVREASQKVSQAYDDVLKNVTFIPDDVFRGEISNISRLAQELPQKESRQFQNILNREVFGPLSKGRGVDGISFKQMESNLGEQASRFLSSTDAYQKSLGDAISELQSSLRSNLVRLNPQYADQLQRVNASFANLVRLQKAAGTVGANEGIFTPSQLAQAVRSSDRTVRKNKYAQGRALMQDLSDAARSAMPTAVPDSGTAERLMLNAGALGSGLYSPAIPAGLAAASVPYFGPVTRAIGSAMTVRPQSAQTLANMLRQIPGGAGAYLLSQ